MGVDVSIKVRFLNKKNEKQFEVQVSDQDNSLDSLLQFYDDKIKYTNIVNDKATFLTEEELHLFQFEETGEMEMETGIVEAKMADKVLKKMKWHVVQKSWKIAVQDINQSRNLEASEEVKLDQQIDKFRNYDNFTHTFGILLGIVKTAAELDMNIQIMAEFY